MTLVSLAEIQAAAQRLRGLVVRTPLLPSEALSEAVGAEVRLKCENLQRTGSFKARGAQNLVLQLPDEQVERGVVTYSSGNHAQAVALAARTRGVRAVVVMPTTAPKVKVQGTRRLGADVVFEGTTSVERKRRAEAISEDEGLFVVPPFDHPHIIAGQGTAGLEVVEEWPDVDTLVVCVGGGGLLSGCAAAAKGALGGGRNVPEETPEGARGPAEGRQARSPGVRVYGVEAAGAASMRAALDAGHTVELEHIDTIADGLAPVRAGELTFEHTRELVDDVVTVDDDDIRSAAQFLVRRHKLVVEFSGAAPTAALRSGAVPDLQGRRVAVIVSGGNIDEAALAGLLDGAA